MIGNTKAAIRKGLFGTCALGTLSALSLFAGCGGGGGSISGGNDNGGAPSVGRFVPNYAEETDPATNQPNRLLHWGRFPVRVHFVSNGHLTAERKSLAIAGFNWWGSAFAGALQLQIVDDPASADIKVKFEPKGYLTYTGITQYTYTSDGRLVSAEVTLNSSFLSNTAQIPGTAAHEFGHAMGIGGHSLDRADLMAPAPNLIGLLKPTLRDENTMKTAYVDMLSGRSASVSGSLHTGTIICGDHN